MAYYGENNNNNYNNNYYQQQTTNTNSNTNSSNNNSSFLGKYIGGPVSSILGGIGRFFFGGETMQVCTILDKMPFKVQSKSQVNYFILFSYQMH